jgi:peroxiredoxin Q/BCP
MRTWKVTCLAMTFAVLAWSSLRAADAGLKVGDAAPSFEAKDDQGQTWKSNDHVGKKVVVVYFFPAALTGG